MAKKSMPTPAAQPASSGPGGPPAAPGQPPEEDPAEEAAEQQGAPGGKPQSVTDIVTSVLQGLNQLNALTSQSPSVPDDAKKAMQGALTTFEDALQTVLGKGAPGGSSPTPGAGAPPGAESVMKGSTPVEVGGSSGASPVYS